ncbi:Arm DNA-binding domain-containing protein [Sphingomonas cannabina]|uniref:tyrosine-type recombinase/integrase n=1 Tax=Sphingomonas cannabina TaxID=2899123 RepID=UPI001F4267A6|nr:integrase arm-type DNA-binding domain-containing protein [Sphingomonas cannabina]UIJ45496.1 Arm DNA-binding domain-containing protein [Sphingomonas cannabina]
MALTVLAIKNARPRAKAYKLFDEHSLFLLVTPTGSKYWRLKYRYLGKDKVLSLGVWPEVSLPEAREARDAARKLVADGIDPAAEKKLKRMRAQFDAGNSFKSVAEEWVTKITREGRAGITLEKVQWLLGMAYSDIGSRPINQIEALEVLAVLRKLEATGRYESARRMRSVISRVLRYGIATGRVQRDVAADLRGAIVVPKTRHYAAITNPRDVGELLRDRGVLRVRHHPVRATDVAACVRPAGRAASGRMERVRFRARERPNVSRHVACDAREEELGEPLVDHHHQSAIQLEEHQQTCARHGGRTRRS